MNIKIRTGVFETNSSSVNTISIANHDASGLDIIDQVNEIFHNADVFGYNDDYAENIIEDTNKIRIHGFEFPEGSEYAISILRFHTPESKISYLFHQIYVFACKQIKQSPHDEKFKDVNSILDYIYKLDIWKVFDEYVTAYVYEHGLNGYEIDVEDIRTYAESMYTWSDKDNLYPMFVKSIDDNTYSEYISDIIYNKDIILSDIPYHFTGNLEFINV